MAGCFCGERIGTCSSPELEASKDPAVRPSSVSTGASSEDEKYMDKRGRGDSRNGEVPAGMYDLCGCGAEGRDWLAAEAPSTTGSVDDMTKDIVVIVGPSGVGKSTLIKQLTGEFSGRFGFSVSHTTRQPRPGEEHGKHYNFTTVDDMKEAIADDRFIEHAEVHGNFYGTSYEAVEQVVSAGQICLLDIDVQGAEQMKKSSLNQVAAYIFVAPPSAAILEERLRGRGTESEEKLRLRLENARKELAFAEENPSFFGKVLVNDDLDNAYMQFKDFMLQQCGTDRLVYKEMCSSD